MSRTITVVTPENITVTYRLAGFASRFLAFLIDLVFQLLLLVLIVLVVRLFSGVDPFGVGNVVSAASIIPTSPFSHPPAGRASRDSPRA